MPILNHPIARVAKDTLGVVAPFSAMEIFVSGSDELAALYGDEDITHTRPNPVAADELGSFQPVYLLSGSYRIVLRNRFGRIIQEVEPFEVLSKPSESGGESNSVAFSFASVEDLIVDTSLTYLSGEVLNTVQEGSRIDAKGGRFRYSVASESSLNWHVLTAGGVKLLYDPLDAATVDAEAFGLRADTGNDQIEFAQRAIDFAATQGGGTVIFPRGNILIDGTLHIGRPDTGLQAVKLQVQLGLILVIPALFMEQAKQ